VVEEEFEDTKGGNQNPYIEEEQTTQWPEEKVQKDKQRSTKHYTENLRSSNTNPTKNWGWTQVGSVHVIWNTIKDWLCLFYQLVDFFQIRNSIIHS
jgi:hypothetical protein